MDLLQTNANVGLKSFKENTSEIEGSSLVRSDAWSLQKSIFSTPISAEFKPFRGSSTQTETVPVLCPNTSTPTVAYKPNAENFESNLAIKNELGEYVEIEPEVIIDEGIPYRDIKEKQPFGRTTCPFCQKVFSTSNNLKQHIEITHEKTVKTCRICDETFTSRFAMEKHVLVKHPETAHPCPVCVRSFILKKNLNRHMELVHVKSSPPCDQARVLFNSNSSQKLRAKSINVDGDKNIPQSDDNSIYSDGNDTNQLDKDRVHLVHQEKDNCHPVKCLKCDKQFSSNANKARHHAIIHQGRRFACEECDYEHLIRRRVLKHCLKSQHDPEKILTVYHGEQSNT